MHHQRIAGRMDGTGERTMMIRAAHIDDVPRLVELVRHAYEAGRVEEQLGPFEAEHFAELWPHVIAAVDAFLFVAEDGGQIVGFTYGGETPVWLAPGAKVTQELLTWVEPEYRERGVGGALIEAIEAWAIEHGATHACLGTYARLSPVMTSRQYVKRGYEALETHFIKRVSPCLG